MQIIPFHRKKKKLSDQELLKMFLKTQNSEFLGELYSRYMHLVYGVCLKYYKEPEKSKDAVILIYEKIQNEIDRYTVKNFKSWLYVVTKNHCLMELRKSKSGTLILSDREEELANFMENDGNLHPIDEEQQNERMVKALDVCIEKLKEEQKQCIRLFYYENKCYREIAEKLNFEEKKIKSYIQNGKRNIKICLEKKNES